MIGFTLVLIKVSNLVRKFSNFVSKNKIQKFSIQAIEFQLFNAILDETAKTKK